jgi:hypothetical protein
MKKGKMRSRADLVGFDRFEATKQPTFFQYTFQRSFILPHLLQHEIKPSSGLGYG